MPGKFFSREDIFYRGHVFAATNIELIANNQASDDARNSVSLFNTRAYFSSRPYIDFIIDARSRV